MRKTLYSLLLLAMFAALNFTVIYADDNDRSFIYNNYEYPKGINKKGIEPAFSMQNVQEEKVDPATGNLEIRTTDLYLEGKNGLDLAITRYYNMQQSNMKEPEVVFTPMEKSVVGYLVEGKITTSKKNIVTEKTTKSDPVPYGGQTVYPAGYKSYAEELVEHFNSGEADSSYYMTDNNGDKFLVTISYSEFEVKRYAGVTKNFGYGTKISQKTVFEKYFDIGAGWALEFPFIEKRGDALYLHYGSSGVWQIDLDDDSNYSKLKDYTMKDLKFEKDTTYNNGQSKYVLTEKDGKKIYFAEHGPLICMADRFGNEIKFDHIMRNGYPVISKITDTVGREISISYDDHDVTISVGDKVVTYQKQEVKGLAGDTNGARSKGETVLKSVSCSVNPNEKRTIRYNYICKYSRDSIVDRNIAHYSNPENNYFEGVYNYYACLSSVEYPTGAKTFYDYNTGIQYSGKDGNNDIWLGSTDLKPDKNIKNCGMEGSMYFYQVKQRYDTATDGQIYNFREYSYKKYNDEGQYDGYPMYVSQDAMPDTYRIETVTDNYMTKSLSANTQGDRIESTDVHSYNKKMLLEQVVNEGANHKYTTIYKYDDNKLLRQVTDRSENRNNPGEFMETVQDYSYDDYKNVTDYWDTQANRLANNELDPATMNSDPHKTTYTYHSIYNYMTSRTYKMNEGTMVTEKYTPSADGKTIEYAEIFENTELKRKTGYEYDTSGNVTRETKYLSDSTSGWSDTNTVIVNYDYNGATGEGAYLTRMWCEGVKDANNKDIISRSGNPEGTIDEIYEYDYFGNLKKFQDANGNIAGYEYDYLDRLTKQINTDHGIGNSSFKTWVYKADLTENSMVFTDENGAKTKVLYDEFGNAKETRVFVKDGQAGGSSDEKALSRNDYDGMFRLKSLTDLVKGAITHYSYTSDGRIKTKAVTGGAVELYRETYDYNDAYYDYGDNTTYYKVSKTISGDVNSPSITTIEYTDKHGNLAKQERIHDNLAYKDEFKYDYVGNRIEEKNARAFDENRSEPYTAKYDYNFEGKVITTYNAEGNFAQNVYDSFGRLKSSSDFKGTKVFYRYDSIDRLIETATPFEKKNVFICSATRYYYDRNGNKTEEEIGEEYLTEQGIVNSFTVIRNQSYEYNVRNMLVMVKSDNDRGRHSANSAKENYVQYYYDPAGNKLRMYTGLNSKLDIKGLDDIAEGSDNEYSVTKYEYDELNRLTKLTDPSGKEETYVYDLNDNLVTYTDRNKNITTMEYDELNRLKTKRVKTPDSSGNKAYSYSYAQTGNIITASGDGTTIGYKYDAFGRLVAETTGDIVKEYTYDANGNRKTFILKQGTDIKTNLDYEYDEMDRLLNLKENSQVIASYGYDENGNRKSLVYANGNSTSYEYNLANKLTKMINYNGTEALSNYEYAYNYDGNQISKKDVITGKLTEYTYDGLGRLYTETETLNDSIIQEIRYSYDDNSNRSGMLVRDENGISTTHYTYDSASRLLEETKDTDHSKEITRYGYDYNGNQIFKKRIVITDNDSAALSFNSYVAGTQQTEEVSFYSYDGFNQLISAIDNGKEIYYTYDANGLRHSKTIDGVTTTSIWDGQNLVLELGASNQVISRYIRGINLIKGYWHDTTATEGYYLFNGHGDVIHLTGNKGSIVKDYDYDAFGVEKGLRIGDNNPFRYCGEYWDSETGTYYLRARYYNPVIGRFTTADTYTGKEDDPLSLNLYTYCGNNPVLFNDPSGHFFNLAAAGIGAAVGAAINVAITAVTDYLDDGQFNKDWKEYAGAVASGAIGGATAGFTMGGSLALI